METIEGLDVPLRSIPFRKPYAQVPVAVRSVTLAKMAAQITCTDNGDPTGTGYGWTRSINIEDPRQWYTSGDSSHRPSDWDDWERVYKYFKVTKARVWVTAYHQGTAISDPTAYGFEFVNFPSRNTAADMAQVFQNVNPDASAFWNLSWKMPKNQRIHIKKFLPWEQNATAGKTTSKASMVRMKRTVNIIKMEQDTPAVFLFDPTESAGPWEPMDYNTWMTTAHGTTEIKYRSARPMNLHVGASSIGDNSCDNAFWLEWVVQWDIVFAGPRFNPIDNFPPLIQINPVP